jgi:aminoglycoside 3-N-acetyltransferase
MPLTVELVADALRAAGLTEGDVVYFHSGLKGLAPVREQAKLPNCGADMVIDAFLAVVGPDGIAACPTHCPGTCIDPATGRSRLVYDPPRTPSSVGSITNVFRQRPGAVRSAHPTHNVTAIGKHAAEFVAGHDTGSTFDANGPHGKLVAWGGKICWFNTACNTHTMTHAVEQWMDLPYMEERDAAALDPDGQVRVVHLTGFPGGPRDFYKKDGSKLSRALDASGLLTRVPVGGGVITLMDAAATCDCIRDCILRDPLLLLNDDMPDHPWVQRARRQTPEHVRVKFGRA